MTHGGNRATCCLFLKKLHKSRKSVSNLGGKTLLCFYIISWQASCREVCQDLKKKKKVEHFVNRLGNGKTMYNMLAANREKSVGGSKKTSSYKGYRVLS